ncbi:MAG TPA: tRNA dihydrouridine synthase DusB [Flavisolibacter sp.]|jgi:nifR3 family TIM-barrel protein|nr:tRNA dihydrouridine synthase DusB [Flavisolibacter sp.]
MRIGSIDLPEFPLLLAPMEDVSDPPFRLLCRQQGADLLFTEFISSEGLVNRTLKCQKKLQILPQERPTGVQLFGGDEGTMARAAAIVDEATPDFLDINFGCPVKGIVAKGAGAGVLKDLKLMVRLTEACVKATHLPVTVKTRLGWDEQHINIEEVAERLQDAGIQALTIHGRTRMQFYKGEADWQLIGKVKNNPRIRIPIFGNGDIDSAPKALAYKNRYGIDGIMIGRAAIGYPWIFREVRHYLTTGEEMKPPTASERIAACRNHLLEAAAWEGVQKAIQEMRGRYAGYLKGLPLVKEEFFKALLSLVEIDALLELFQDMERHYDGFRTEREAIQLKNYHQHCEMKL